MDRASFETYIKGLSVDEMVQMMPQSIKMKCAITPSMRRHNYHQGIPEELDDYEYEYYLSMEASGDWENVTYIIDYKLSLHCYNAKKRQIMTNASVCSFAYDEMREYKPFYAWKMTYEFEGSKDKCCKEMLLWLYDNNLLPTNETDG